MDEGFDNSTDASVDTDVDDSVDVVVSSDLPASERADINSEPLADVPVEEITMDSLNDLEPPISDQEMSELQNGAEALEIQPFDDVIDLGYNYDDAIQAANEIAGEQSYEPSAFLNILTEGAKGATSPGEFAQLIAEADSHVPHGAEGVVAQGLQATWNMGVAGSREMMDATIRQHGKSPAGTLENMQIQQAIDDATSNFDPLIPATDDSGERAWVRHPSDDKTER